MPAVIQGFLMKRAINSGKNWKKRYFVLDFDGTLSFSDKKGSAVKGSIEIGKLSQINALKEDGETGMISIVGSAHKPWYLQAESTEVAEGWIQALNIVKNGGSGKKNDNKQGDTLRAAFANKGALGSSGKRMGTLERKKKGKKNAEPEPESTEKDRPCSINPLDLPPPPPPCSDDEEDVPIVENSNTNFTDGYIMNLKGRDYFVDSQGFEYYESRKAFLNNEKPLGRALLSLLV